MRIQVSRGKKRKLPEIYKRKNDSDEFSDKRKQISVQDLREGSEGARHICGSGTDKALTIPSACIIDTLDSVDKSSNITRASSSDVDSERSCRVNYSHCSITSNLGCKRITVGPERVNLSTDGEDDPSWDQQLSLAKALRAAMLKERFSEVILKAEQKTLLNQGESVEPTRMKQERQKLVKKHHEEKARIVARVKAAEAAVRMKEEANLKMQREKQREAARLALQKMERTVELDNNSELRTCLKEAGLMFLDCMYDSDQQLSDAAVDGDDDMEEGEIR